MDVPYRPSRNAIRLPVYSTHYIHKGLRLVSRDRQPLFRDLDHLYAAAPPALSGRLPGWSRPILRRVLYGLPHSYRRGTSAERRRLMSLFLALQFILIFVGGTTGLLFLRFDRYESTLASPALAWAYPVFGFAGTLLLLGPPTRWLGGGPEPRLFLPWAYHLLVFLIAIASALFCYSLGGFGLATAPFFLPCAAYSFTFFANWRALLYTSTSSMLFGLMLIHNDVRGAYAAMAFLLLVSLVLGGSFGLVVSREWSFRQSNLLSVAVISHQLRTPLVGIIARGRETLTNTSLHTVPTLLEDVRKITNRAEELAQLLVQLLEVTRSEVSVSPIEPSRFDVRETLFKLEGDFSSRALANNQVLELRVPPEPCLVYGDRGKIAEAVSNLIDNALKFSPEGGTVRLELTADDELFSIRISDSGPGVAVGDREMIFRPFSQGSRRPSGRTTGAGLGLPLARIYALQHGGDLLLDDRDAMAGATFRLRLPVARLPQPNRKWYSLRRRVGDIPGLAESPRPSESAQSRRAGPPEETGRIQIPVTNELSVLIVDDILDDLDLAKTVISRQGFRVATADSGSSAMDLLRSTTDHYDLVLLDIHLPDTTGPELLWEIRALPEWTDDTPIIAYTAFAERNADEAFRRQGFHGYLMKPLPVDGIPAHVLGLIRRRERR